MARDQHASHRAPASRTRTKTNPAWYGPQEACRGHLLPLHGAPLLRETQVIFAVIIMSLYFGVGDSFERESEGASQQPASSACGHRMQWARPSF